MGAMRSMWRTMVLGALLSLPPGQARAAEEIVDGFSDATAQTQYVPDSNVVQATIGSTTRVDADMTQVLGGVRELTVSASAIQFAGLDSVTAGVSLLPVTFFEYNSTDGADGAIALVFDRGGIGLGAFLAFAQGIRVTLLSADASAVVMPGMDVSVTLSDGTSTVTRTQTVSMQVVPGTPLDLDFAFADFTGVDAGALASITIAADPQVAGDLRIAPVATYGTPLTETICDDGIDNNNNGLIDCRDGGCVGSPDCSYQAPALSSPLGVGVALLLLTLIGGARLGRRPR